MIEKELPIVPLLTIVRAAGEYVLIEVRMQGDEVVSRDVIDYGRQFEAIWDAFRVAATTRFGRKDIQ